MPTDYLELLRRHDDPVLWEYPEGFDHTRAVLRFRRFAEHLESRWEKPIRTETEIEIQDASFHSQIFVSVSHGGRVVIRFSNFGDMATFEEEAAVPDDLRETLLSLFEHHGYVYVPYDVLTEPYTGSNPGVTGIRDWWIRYFDWV
ncbi:MAG: hypothetical protein ACF8R7_13055 [Phycisphaerales bacterium JB039]